MEINQSTRAASLIESRRADPYPTRFRLTAVAGALWLLQSTPAAAAVGFDYGPNMRLTGGVRRVLKRNETFQCLAACSAAKDFQCKVAEFEPGSGRCRLGEDPDSVASAPDLEVFRVKEVPGGHGRCADNLERSGALCYPKCRKGYRGVGPLCWQRCPSGYKDDGATCRKPVRIIKRGSRGRGLGKPLSCGVGEERDGALCYPNCKAGYNGVGPVCWQRCEAGYVNDGATCRRKGHIFAKKSYGRGRGKVLRRNCSGSCERDAGLWYPRCNDGYRGRGPVCWQYCPDGYKNDGATCRKPVKVLRKRTYGRGAGKPLHACNSDWERSGALCYPKCGPAAKGVGPVCWAACPSGYKTDGATCRKPGRIIGKKSYGRGVGYLQRGNLKRLFHSYIAAHRRINRKRAKPLTEDEKAFLAPLFPKRMIDAVRVVEKRGRTGFGNLKSGATTYGSDLILVKKGSRTTELLKHEMVHACQYEKLGTRGFAEKYAEQWLDAGYRYSQMAFERDAYDFERNVHTPIGDYLGVDNNRGSLYSVCK